LALLFEEALSKYGYKKMIIHIVFVTTCMEARLYRGKKQSHDAITGYVEPLAG